MRAATRVNAEQASKRATRRPTLLNNGDRLCTWLRFDQHAVGKGLCIGGEAEERAESSVAGFAAVEAKDELIEIGLQMLAAQPVVDASRPSFEVGEDLVDPRQDEVSGGLPDDMDIVAIVGNRSVAGPAVGLGDGVGIGVGFDEVSEVGGGVGGDFGQPQAAWDVSVPEFDGADDEHLAVVAASLPSAGTWLKTAAARTLLDLGRPGRMLLRRKFTDGRDVHRLVKDESALADWIKASVWPGWHVCGTCRMGPDADPLAVLDGECRVRGVPGLRVVDVSVMPTIPRANTNLTTIAIAEKIADGIRLSP